MNVLIIPCREGESPAELYASIHQATKICEAIILDAKDLPEHIRRTVTWASVTAENPYVEIKVNEQ